MEPALARPDPDAILAKLRDDESRSKRGRLKVFLGMCPGVGKTHAMLRAAQQERLAKVDVVVGLVETHGRVETAAVLAELSIIPRRETAYKGTTVTEMDLTAILARKPQLVLVDELAHTNAPGSLHAKRWQDVLDLLEAGIGVFTTLNIQHVESRSDAVQQITGAPVHETVPDSLLDLADEVELVDLTPERLLERLREGKVYLGERAIAAEENFFQESNLTALRELALRFTAERVDQQLRMLRASTTKQTVWRSGERLLVAVAPSPFSTQLVRWTRRLAAAQGAAWCAVHVETSAPLTPEEQRLLDKNLSLARELGAEVILTRDNDIVAALVRTALQHNATQIVVGKPRGNRFLEFLHGGTLVDRLIRQGGNIDIYVVPAEHGERSRRWPGLDEALRSDPKEYGIAAGTVIGITLAAWFLPVDYYLAVGLVLLLAVIVLSLRVGRWPVLVAGVLSAFCWNFFFIPPRFTFVISKVEDVILFCTYFVVALVAGQLTSRIRAQGANERVREERATALLRLTRALAGAKTLDEAAFAAMRQVDELFGARTALFLADASGANFHSHFASSYAPDEKECAVAEWVFRNRRNAGRFTDTLPASTAFYLPLIRDDKPVGVLGVQPPPEVMLTLSQRDLIEAFARQLALIVEREELRAASEREKLLAESEKLHHALLDSVSHELRTPLAVITAAVENLNQAGTETRGHLVAEIRTAARRLNRLVGNLLDQTRLETGVLRPNLDWHDPRDLVNAALDDTRDALAGHPLTVNVAEQLSPVLADQALMVQALSNLLLNTAQHTPSGTPASVNVGLERGGRRVAFVVADTGPGLPAPMREKLFQKFSRGESARAGGLGLGLPIVRGFIAAQGGDLIADENPGGGARFTIYLPHAPQQNSPPE